MGNLVEKKCTPCEGGAVPINHDEAHRMLKEIPGWSLHEIATSPAKGRKGHLQIEHEFKFKNFKEAMGFVNKIAELAENEGHHPDIFIHGWNKVLLTFYTHAIGGLSENDFIMAAKVNALAPPVLRTC